MDIEQKCIELNEEFKTSTKRSKELRNRITPITFERLKKTANLLNISRNELINYILNKVLL